MVLIPEGFAQVNFKFVGITVPTGAECTLGLAVSAFGGTPAEAAQALGFIWASTISTTQVNNCDLSSTLVKFGPTDVGPSAEVLTPGAGGKTNTSVTPNTSVLVQKLTNAGGRAGKGRMFIPGVRESEVNDSGEISVEELEDWQEQLDAFQAGIEGADLFPRLLHGEGSPLSAPTIITSFSVQSLVATQRRRMRR